MLYVYNEALILKFANWNSHIADLIFLSILRIRMQNYILILHF